MTIPVHRLPWRALRQAYDALPRTAPDDDPIVREVMRRTPHAREAELQAAGPGARLVLLTSAMGCEWMGSAALLEVFRKQRHRYAPEQPHVLVQLPSGRRVCLNVGDVALEPA